MGKVYGAKVVEFRKPMSFPICCTIATDQGNITFPCCCMLPSLETFTNENEKIGESKYICDQNLCVPKFGVYDETGKQVYLVKPDTCSAVAFLCSNVAAADSLGSCI